MPLPVAATRAAVPTAGETSALTVRSGDNLGRLFAQRGLSQSDLAAILRSGPDAKGLRSVRVGQVVTVIHNDSGHVFGLSTSLDAARELIVQDTTQGYKASVGAIPFSTSRAYAHGVIENSLFDAAERAGLSDKVTMQLIHLFGWDIDFAHDVRSGDAFTVLYQKFRRQGGAETDGPILAAEFTTQGETYRMIRFQAPDGTVGYYTPKGNSVRKALLRAPVAFTRISSGFSLHRMNPVLHYIRPHYGTDYAAPMGTPIVAAGDGRIVFRGRKGGFGRCIVINDGGGYTTLYGHMSRFRAGQQVGSRVQQGEIIGFVGMSGEATGPHLHYQIMVHGVPRNPRTLKLPDGPPVPAKYRSAFLQEVNVLLAQMSNDANVRVAASSNAVGGGAAKVSRTQ
ncbi:MAG: peptidoglycan DD-metalloendopeptidase family protein [Gammaproteobacteria bacterium]